LSFGFLLFLKKFFGEPFPTEGNHNIRILQEFVKYKKNPGLYHHAW